MNFSLFPSTIFIFLIILPFFKIGSVFFLLSSHLFRTLYTSFWLPSLSNNFSNFFLSKSSILILFVIWFLLSPNNVSACKAPFGFVSNTLYGCITDMFFISSAVYLPNKESYPSNISFLSKTIHFISSLNVLYGYGKMNFLSFNSSILICTLSYFPNLIINSLNFSSISLGVSISPESGSIISLSPFLTCWIRLLNFVNLICVLLLITLMSIASTAWCKWFSLFLALTLPFNSAINLIKALTSVTIFSLISTKSINSFSFISNRFLEVFDTLNISFIFSNPFFWHIAKYKSSLNAVLYAPFLSFSTFISALISSPKAFLAVNTTLSFSLSTVISPNS